MSYLNSPAHRLPFQLVTVCLPFVAMGSSLTAASSTESPSRPAPESGATGPDNATVDSSQETLKRLDEIEQSAMAYWQNVKTLRANLVTREDHPDVSARPDQEGGGYYDVLREGDRSLHRLALLTDLVDRGGERVNTWSRMTTLFDGEFVWVLRETSRQKAMIKMDRPPQQPLELIGPGLFTTLREFKGLSFHPDEELQGRPVHVLTAQTTNGQTTLTFKIDAETGLAMKTVFRDAFQNAEKSIEVVGTDFEAEFKEDHFAPTPPEGVEVRDMTRAAREAPATDVQTPDSEENPGARQGSEKKDE